MDNSIPRAGVSRRRLIGAGAVAGATIAALPGTAMAAARKESDHADAVVEAASLPTGPVMLYVADAANHEVGVLAGDQEYTVRDVELVRRMARAARQAG